MKKLFCVVFVLWRPLWLHSLDREAFTFTKYDLDVRVEPEQQRLGVRGRVTLRNDSDSPQRSVSLQISSSLNWSSITLQGKPVEYVRQPYVSDIDHTGALSEAIVVLPQAVAPKQSVELEVGYEGVIPLDTTRLTRIGVPGDAARHTDWDQIGRTFTAVRGIGHVTWYPIATEAVNLRENDALPVVVARWRQREEQSEMKATFTHYSSTSGQPKVLCDGPSTPMSYEQMGASYEGETQCSFLAGREAPLFVVGDFETSDQPIANIFYLAEHKSSAEDYASALDEVAPLAEKWIGDHRQKTETKAEVVDLPNPQAASYESGNMLLMPLSGSDTKQLLSAARQTTRIFLPSSRMWIREGLANYAQVRLIEEKEGRQAAIAYLEAHRGALVASERAIDSKNEARSLIDNSDDFRVATKAMYVWYMLREVSGEGALQVALHNYKAADDNSPSYMQKLIEAEAHRDLQWFFDDWVYHDRGLPDFRIASVYPSELPSGGYMVTVTVENLGGAGAEVPVTLHMQGGERSDRLIIHGKSKASIRIQAPSLPQTVSVNDGSVPESDMSNNQYTIQSLNH